MPETRIVQIKDLQTHPEPYVTAIELAEYFHVSDKTVYKLADAGQLEVVRIGRAVRFSTESARRMERPDGQGRE